MFYLSFACSCCCQNPWSALITAVSHLPTEHLLVAAIFARPMAISWMLQWAPSWTTRCLAGFENQAHFLWKLPLFSLHEPFITGYHECYSWPITLRVVTGNTGFISNNGCFVIGYARGNLVIGISLHSGIHLGRHARRSTRCCAWSGFRNIMGRSCMSFPRFLLGVEGSMLE